MGHLFIALVPEGLFAVRDFIFTPGFWNGLHPILHKVLYSIKFGDSYHVPRLWCFLLLPACLQDLELGTTPPPPEAAVRTDLTLLEVALLLVNDAGEYVDEVVIRNGHYHQVQITCLSGHHSLLVVTFRCISGELP